MKKILFTLVSISVTTSALLIGLLGAEQRIISNFPTFDRAFDFLVYVSIALLCISAISLILLALGYLYRICFVTKPSGHGWDFCKESDLDSIQEIAESEIPNPTELNQTKALYRHNRKCIRKIINNKDNNRIVGYVFLMPLTLMGIEKIERKSFSVFSDDLSAFSRAGLRSGADYYVGAIVGTTRQARFKAMEVVRDFCKEKRVRRLFAKAATDDGLRVLKRRDFTPYSSEDKPELGVLFVRELATNQSS